MKKPNKFYARVKRGAPTIFTVLRAVKMNGRA